MNALRILTASALVLVSVRGSGQTPITLYNFTGGADGWDPNGLVQGSDGNFYGTTSQGGLTASGTVFKITTAGTLTTLYHFSGPDGAQPTANLIQANDGNFYGTTYYGGTNGLGGTNSFGTIFKISSAGTFTTLYEFGGPDGEYPTGPLVQGADGNFYGATISGGTNIHGYSFGTVFKMTPSGALTTLRQFKDDSYGRYPAGLVASGDGGFYGTTADSTIFRIDSTGAIDLLFTATASGDPSFFQTPLVRGSTGEFCGLAIDGGAFGWGAIYKFSPNSVPSVTNLYSFNCDFCSYYAVLGPEGSDGNFYGTTWGGGAGTNCTWGCGMAIRVSPNGGLTTLWSFTDSTDGAKSFSGLVQGTDGNFYGTTSQGGTHGYGTVFKISAPLDSSADQISDIQFFNVFGATNVAILIPSVAGETYQLQHSDSLSTSNWFNIGGSVISLGGPLILLDFAGSLPSQRFYRAVITP